MEWPFGDSEFHVAVRLLERRGRLPDVRKLALRGKMILGELVMS